MLKRLAHLFSATFTILGIAATLIALANVGAFFLFAKAPATIWSMETSVLNHVISPVSDQGLAILARGFGEDAARKIQASHRNAPNPYFAAHPTLHYISHPTRNGTYTIGVEGIRYIDGWTDDRVRELLSSDKKKVFLLGGSTVFGHGLSDGQTIAAYLQEILGGDYAVFNFGVGAYDQLREIDLLVYLLRRGRKPDHVIFLDGVNDFYGMARSNYRVSDKIVYHGFTAGRGDVTRGNKAFTMGARSSTGATDILFMLAHAMPATRLFVEQSRPTFDLAAVPAVIDPFETPLDYAMAEFMYFNWASFGEKNLDLMRRQILEYYQKNTQFLSKLQAAYGFHLGVYYQPNGWVDSKNPFKGSPPPGTPGLRYLAELDSLVRAEIAGGRLAMIDISQELAPLSAMQRAYIDVAHYSPIANAKLAEIFREGIVRK